MVLPSVFFYVPLLPSPSHEYSPAKANISTKNHTYDQLKENIPGKQASGQFFQVVSICHHPLTDLGLSANEYSPKMKWK